MKKRGQAAIFVIVAIVIIVAGVLVYLFVPQVQTVFSGEIVPGNYLRNCFQEDFQSNLDALSEKGGYQNPEGYVQFRGSNVKYLCYTSQYYLPCKVQQPLIARNFEIELERITQAKVDECVANLKSEYESKGYEVTLDGATGVGVDFIPDKINVLVTAPMTISKEGTQTFRAFNIEIPSKMYNLVMIATSIVSYESTYGNTATDIFVQYYPDIDIDKIELEGGTTVFTVRDVISKEEFTFASRSQVWPGGLGLTA